MASKTKREPVLNNRLTRYSTLLLGATSALEPLVPQYSGVIRAIQGIAGALGLWGIRRKLP